MKRGMGRGAQKQLRKISCDSISLFGDIFKLSKRDEREWEEKFLAFSGKLFEAINVRVGDDVECLMMQITESQFKCKFHD